MAKYDVVLSVGLKNGDVDMAISMLAAELCDTTADEVRAMLTKAVERFDEFRREHPRTPRPKKFYPRIAVPVPR